VSRIIRNYDSSNGDFPVAGARFTHNVNFRLGLNVFRLLLIGRCVVVALLAFGLVAFEDIGMHELVAQRVVFFQQSIVFVFWKFL
jgi:hypothetical protein